MLRCFVSLSNGHLQLLIWASGAEPQWWFLSSSFRRCVIQFFTNLFLNCKLFIHEQWTCVFGLRACVRARELGQCKLCSSQKVESVVLNIKIALRHPDTVKMNGKTTLKNQQSKQRSILWTKIINLTILQNFIHQKVRKVWLIDD